MPESNTEYFVSRHGNLLGPFQLGQLKEELKAERIDYTDIAAARGDAEWEPLSKVIQKLEEPPKLDALQQQLKESQQRVKELEVEQNSSISRCAIYSIVWFFLLMVFPILMTYVIPKFKTIFADMLGPGETLPEFTLLVLKISDTIKYNAIAAIPLWFPLLLGFVFFIGFKSRFLEKNLCRSINALSIVLFLVFLLGVVLAMFLPLIKMMDKLGQ